MVPGTVVSKIKQTRRLTGHEFAFLKQHSPGEVKVTLPTANQFPAIYYKKGISDKVYPDHSAFLWDIVPVIKSEIASAGRAKASRTCRSTRRATATTSIPSGAATSKTKWDSTPTRRSTKRFAPTTLASKARRRDGVILAIHLCRGNNRSQWYAEGGYDAIAEKLFGQLDVDAFLLEYESERAGTFEPLRFVPRGKTVVLGLVSSKLAELEISR